MSLKPGCLLSLCTAAIALHAPTVAAQDTKAERSTSGYPDRAVGRDVDRTLETRPPDSVSAALDSLIREERIPAEIPGLALVYLRDADVAFTEGYGAADVDSGRPVSPEDTRFPFGSLSKLVTATAVMQLVESGKVSPRSRAGEYLAPDILPQGPGRPITLHHLLTHTAGFEPANLGVAAKSRAEILGLEDYLSSRLPRRVRLPGELYVYSQHGYGLLGLVLEAVTGRSFQGYAQDEIFRPLGMESAAFRRSAVPETAVATGYYGGDHRRRAPVVHHQIPPAGGLIATPVDVARLLAAHLAGESAVLQGKTARRMQRRQWSPHPHPEVEGTSYGLFEYYACGIRALTSRGWVGGHSAYVHMVPARGVGFLVAANASSLQGLDQRLRETLHVHLARGDCGDAGEDGDPPAESNLEGRGHDSAAGSTEPEVTGSYRSIGYGGKGVEAVGRLLLSPVLTVRRRGDSLIMDFGSETAKLTRIDRRLYRASWWEGRDQNFVFLHVEGNEPRHMMWGGQAYERIPWFLRPEMVWAVLAGAGLLFLSVLIGGVVRIARDLMGNGGEAAHSGRVLRNTAFAVSALYLLFGVGMSLELAGTGRYRFAFGLPATARLLLWAPLLGSVLSLILATGLLRAWRRKLWSLPRRLYWSAITVTALAISAGALALGLLPA